VSLGGSLYRRAMTALVEAASALREGDLSAASGGISIDEVAELLPG
jgi:hypothetical protein